MASPEATQATNLPADETNEALRHLGRVAGTLLAILVLVYAVPPLHRFRPWMPGDPWLVLRHYGARSGGEQSIATGGARVLEAPTSREALTRELGRAVAESLRPHEVTAPSGPRTRIDPNEYEGLEQHLVDPSGGGMRPFYEALLRTAREEPHAVTRVAHYGDSSIATDRITSTVRRDLQLRFGDAGHGFVLIAKGYMPYRHIGLDHEANDAWLVQEVTRRARGDGRYGFGGIVLRGGAGARALYGSDADDEAPVGKSVSRFELWYSTGPRLGQVELRIDGGEPRSLSTTSESPGEGVERIDLPDGAHRMQLRALSTVELYGVVLERDVPGVVYDSLGLVGARANRLLNFDAAHVRSQLERRGTDLLVLGFGGNEASDHIDPVIYERDFEAVVDRMRGDRQDLGCLIVAPLDQAGREGGAIRTFRGLPLIVEAQRRVAERKGCAFFDTFAAMGGQGAMARWYRSNPPLASGDFRHATPEGYEVIGNMIYKALLEGFARYLAEHGSDTAAPSAR